MPSLSHTNRWAALALMFFARTSMAIQFQSIPPLAPLLIEEWGINFAQVGLLIGLFMTAGIFLALPGGLLGQRFGDKTVVMAGLGLMTAGTLIFGAAPSFSIAFAGRLLGGIGVVLLNVQLAKMTTNWFAGKEIATAMGLLLTSWPLGIALSLSTLALVATVSSWRTAILLTAAVSGLALVLFGLFYRDPAAGSPIGSGGMKRPRLWVITNTELVLILSAAMVWMVPNTAFITFIGFAPTMLAAGGMTLATAGFMVGLANLICIGSNPLGGWLTDLSGRFNGFIVVGILGCSLAFFLAAIGFEPLFWAVLFGIALGVWPGAVMSLPSQVLSPSGRGTGFGVFYTVYYVGMAIFPPIAGWLQDATGSATASVWFSTGVMALTLPVLALFRFMQSRSGTASVSESTE